MTDRGTGRSRGFGFVSFDTPDPVDQIMAMHKAPRRCPEETRSDQTRSNWERSLRLLVLGCRAGWESRVLGSLFGVCKVFGGRQGVEEGLESVHGCFF